MSRQRIRLTRSRRRTKGTSSHCEQQRESRKYGGHWKDLRISKVGREVKTLVRFKTERVRVCRQPDSGSPIQAVHQCSQSHTALLDAKTLSVRMGDGFADKRLRGTRFGGTVWARRFVALLWNMILQDRLTQNSLARRGPRFVVPSLGTCSSRLHDV